MKELRSRGEGASPEDGDNVQVNYVGRVLGKEDEFDRNHGGYPFEFSVGEGKVVKGWEHAIKVLKVGDKAVVELRTDYGYGDAGSEDDVPPGATLVFEIELVDIKERIKGSGAADRERLVQLRAEREAAAAAAAEKKKAIAAKAGAKTALAEKLANKGKKGGGKKAGEKKEWKKPEKKEPAAKKGKGAAKKAAASEAPTPPGSP